MKRIYAMELESHVVKIGVSKDVALRMQQVAYARKERVINVHFTEFAPNTVARRIEQACHEAFADRRLFGEYFDITFAEACAMLDSYADEIELAAIDEAAAEVERIDRLGDDEDEQPRKMTVSEALKRFRKAKKLTQRQVAEVIGVSPQLYHFYESKGELSSKVIVALSKNYDVTADYLLGLSDESKPVIPRVPVLDADGKIAKAVIDLAAMLQEALANREKSVAEVAHDEQ